MYGPSQSTHRMGALKEYDRTNRGRFRPHPVPEGGAYTRRVLSTPPHTKASSVSGFFVPSPECIESRVIGRNEIGKAR